MWLKFCKVLVARYVLQYHQNSLDLDDRFSSFWYIKHYMTMANHYHAQKSMFS